MLQIQLYPWPSQMVFGLVQEDAQHHSTQNSGSVYQPLESGKWVDLQWFAPGVEPWLQNSLSLEKKADSQPRHYILHFSFPFGFLHILRGFYANEHVDMLLIGIDKKHQNLGASALVFNDLSSTFLKKGVKYVSTGPMLATNLDVLSLWKHYMEGLDEISIRRRCYITDID